MINAAITPGTQPHNHKINTITMEPQPLSKTANGGQIIANNTLQILINLQLFISLRLQK